MKKIFMILLTLILAISVFVSPTLAEENSVPELEKGVLLYSFKNNIFSYKFQVEYKDADGNMPRYMFVFVNGSRREMVKADINDNNPKDGILYILNMDQEELFKLAPKAKEWEIEYWFRTNDGQGPVSTKISKLFVLDTEAMGLTASNSAGGGSSAGGSSSGGGCGCGK
ncbi:MAG: hypothetical protein APG12_00778 [Candidatus Methanofastidiosum methylothiophilum]|uniref:Uncharacterized protein n=1 Tax=Candidatus Methanofastidiosum methylothiophilum TaxID=1705564 RepID=A0A150IZN5_9EURY|nr:MAG: hypothetical protein APG10_00506 [Candidatus Methanofastidiosum methylthiophilus]KYC48055.1 MAG: hypothetical protein APG11_00625 [Candidatus Methanofastidiosum methylthiophilus]KYC50446.1 MAG: hypothetical protein APG12_00778 [Candidatus Methanofastidiosum methylthiophilus]